MVRFHCMMKMRGEVESRETFLEFEGEPTEAEFFGKFSEALAPELHPKLELLSIMQVTFTTPEPAWLKRLPGKILGGVYRFGEAANG